MATAVNTVSLPEETVRESIRYIAENLRQADRDEILALAGPELDPFDALMESHQLSALDWIILDRTGLPIGIMGVAPKGDGRGVAWMMGSEGVIREGRSIALQTRYYLAEMQALYPTLWAFVDARNAVSLAWLSHNGFSITEAHADFGPQGLLFFEMTRTPAFVRSNFNRHRPSRGDDSDQHRRPSTGR